MIELGPVQNEDVLILQAVIKMTCPKKLVELGHLNGYSASKILEVMREDAELISYDPTVDTKIKDTRFIFKKLSQVDYEDKDIDFIFFDASHDLKINMDTFSKVEPTLNKDAIIMVHDTGLWNEMIQDTGGYFIENGYAHRPDERLFVKQLKEKGYNLINLGTLNELRHGMSILQKNFKMEDINKDIYVTSTVFWNDLQQIDGFMLRGGVEPEDVKSGKEHFGVIKNGVKYQKVFIKSE